MKVSDCDVSATVVEIPARVMYNGELYDVTSIGDYAFYNCSSFTSIDISSSVTSIGNYAFRGCYVLTFIDIPSSVTSIGDYAFLGCSSLTSITIPSSVTSIGNSTFSNCSSLTAVDIPNSVTAIGGSAFNKCSSLTTIDIPNSVTSIGSYAFECCSSLASITIPNSVTSIGNSTFYNCSSLTSVTIPNSVTSIGDWAFRGCSSLTSITIPNSVTSIVYGTFSSCSSLTSIDIPNSVTSIGNSAFYNCSSLTSVTIPNSVTSIGSCAFSLCSSLTSVTIPNSVTSIGSWAFEYCSSLTSVTCLKETAPSLGVDVFSSTPSTKVLNIPCGSDYSSWESATDWASVERIGCEEEECVDVFTIGDLTYEKTSATTVSVKDCSETATEVIIPASVEQCGITYSVTSIGEYAFEDCSSLTSIDIPNGVTSIGTWAFAYCSSLTSVDIPNGVTSIGDYAFVHCYNLTSVTIPSSVTSIGGGAFSGCSSLETISIPNGVTAIGSWAFSDCFFLISIDIPNGVTSIGDFAFYVCRSLTSIDIPNSVTSIGNYTFCDCSSLTSIDIPNGVTSIGDYAFGYCSNLTSVTIPNSVTSIGYWAFEGCDNLTSVTCLGETAPSLGESVFASTPSTKVLNIPCGSDYSSWESATDWASVECIDIDVDLGNGLTYFPLTFAIISEEEHTMEVSDCDASATDVEIPARVMYNGKLYDVTSIGVHAFAYCSSLTSVTIPNSVTSIGDWAFQNCSSLTSVTIPNSVTSISRHAFYWCSSLTSITIPNSVTSIGAAAFDGCSSLTSVTIPNSVTSIGDWAFQNCSSLTSITIPNSVTSIRTGAFASCHGLISVTIPNSVTSIGENAFQGCSRLTSVTIPNSVTSIGQQAFYNCSRLTSVTIPNSVTSIGSYAFRDCSSLTSVTCLRETAPSLGASVFSSTPSTKVLNIPFGSDYSSWQSATDWSKTNYLIQEGKTKELANDFTINSTTGLINEGVLRIKQGGQLINETGENVSGIFEVEAVNRDDNWNYIGAPFNNYTLSSILPQTNDGNLVDVSVSLFNHNTGAWRGDWATFESEVATGESFAAWNWGTSPITFTTYGDIWNYETNQAGEYNYGTPTAFTLFNEDEITITHQDNNSEDNVNWLSVANPYTFKLDIAQIRTDNDLQGDVLYTYDGTTFQPVETGEIAVTEGFFVNNTTLKFKKGQRKTNIAKSTKQKDYIKLIMTDTDTQSELLFTQNDKANANYDRFDANKLFSPKEITEPYFVTDGQALVKEEVKELPYTATLNIKSYENKDITIKITNIPEGVNVFLLDNGQDIKMNGGVEYNTRIIAGENADRFKVLFKKQHRLEKINDNQITITNNNRQISVKSDKTDLNIEVYNQLGQKVFSTNEYNFTLSKQPAGSYVIKAYQGRYSKSKKIVIE